LPPMPQQRRMLALLENLSHETDRLAALYETKLAALEELKTSVLRQAFTVSL
jgi:type I restriction enzyme, S subunit